jgi:hypothetical protein
MDIGLWCPKCALRIASVALDGAPNVAKELIDKARVALTFCTITYNPARNVDPTQRRRGI